MKRILFSGIRGAAQGLKDSLSLERDRQILRHAADAEAREFDLPDPKPLEELCVKHSWNPPPPFPGAPRPDRSECPECRAEALGENRSAEEVASIFRPQVYDPTRAPDRFEEALERHERKLARKHHPVPGSFEHRAMLAARVDSYDPEPVSQETVKRMAVEHLDTKRVEEREKLDETFADRQRRYRRAQARAINHDPARARYA